MSGGPAFGGLPVITIAARPVGRTAGHGDLGAAGVHARLSGASRRRAPPGAGRGPRGRGGGQPATGYRANAVGVPDRVPTRCPKEASLLIASGATDMKVCRQMGHAKVETTKNIYGHLFAKDQAEILNAMNQAVTRHYVEDDEAAQPDEQAA